MVNTVNMVTSRTAYGWDPAFLSVSQTDRQTGRQPACCSVIGSVIAIVSLVGYQFTSNLIACWRIFWRLASIMCLHVSVGAALLWECFDASLYLEPWSTMWSVYYSCMRKLDRERKREMMSKRKRKSEKEREGGFCIPISGELLPHLQLL